MPPTRTSRASKTQRMGKNRTAVGEDMSATGKGEGQPYPTSRPLRDSVRQKKKKNADKAPVSPNIEPCGQAQHSNSLQLRSPQKMKKKTLPPSTRRREDVGTLTRTEFTQLEEQYLAALHSRKKVKALISQAMFDKIWLVLNKPDDRFVGTSQFRWWARKMFGLVPADTLWDEAAHPIEARPTAECIRESGTAVGRLVVVHDGKRLAVREQIYDILCACHERVGHAGRDRTTTEINQTYTWVPKDLVALFIKNCRTCVYRKTGKITEPLTDRNDDLVESKDDRVLAAVPVPQLHAPEPIVTHAQYFPLPTQPLVADPRTGLLLAPGNVYAPLVRPPHMSLSTITSGLSLPEARLWLGPPPTTIFGTGSDHFPPIASYAMPQRYQLDARLNAPSHSADGLYMFPGDGRVTLSPLSEALSGPPMDADCLTPWRSRAKQPLQTLSENALPATTMLVPLQTSTSRPYIGPSQTRTRKAVATTFPSSTSLSVIDPVLLGDSGIAYPEYAS